uniref:G protein gamma domain-containing protein n=1 Tax=Heterorhabditis bacteriophora TaxID=37862 RepID=A0A1I7XPW7_HETBA
MEDVPISRGRGRPAAAPADSYSMSGGDSSPYIPLPSTSRRSINKINECITNIEPVILTQRWTVQNSIRADNSLVISCTIELIPDVSRIPCKKVQQSACAITDMVNVSRKHLEDGIHFESYTDC